VPTRSGRWRATTAATLQWPFRRVAGPASLPAESATRRSLDDRHGAVCGTGVGEAFIRLGLCRVAIVELEHGMDPAEVAKKAIDWLGRSMNAAGGIILMGREGDPQAAFNTPAMPWAKRVG